MTRYLAAVVVTVVAILSQYFVPELVPSARPLYGSLVGDLAVVYGFPVIAFLLLVGVGPLRHWRRQMGTATVEGLRWYGALSLLGFGVVVLLTIVYLAVDPATLHLLQRPNPALQQAAGDPWFYVGLSFAVGAVEETIFRGWIYGFWAARSANWLAPALVSSALFAAVHLYYGTTYGAAAPLIFPSLFLLGLAFAAAFQYSGGNLVVIALLHGVFDASAFLTLVSPTGGEAIRYGSILLGALVALVVYLREARATAPVPGWGGGGWPPSGDGRA